MPNLRNYTRLVDLTILQGISTSVSQCMENCYFFGYEHSI